jgi:hypothetical protein
MPMTDSDERLLAVAKLREALRGDLDHGDHAHPHAGLVENPKHRSTLSFLERVVDGPLRDTALGAAVLDKWTTDAATDAVFQGNGSVASHITGITEQDLSANALRLPMQLLDQLDNNDAPAFVTVAGNPNTGKTNTVLLLAQLRALDLDDLLVVGNIDAEFVDERIASAHDLAVTLLEYREEPKFVFVDEGSTHFDSRTNRREVATQWTPLAKRFAKIGVDTCGIIGHTGKDLHPEVKRLTTLGVFKATKRRAEFYDRWPADADFPADQLFGGDLEDLEKSSIEYDPNDAAPWSWNLRADLFAEDFDWPELLDLLRDRGPAEE